ncbi:hypothetical protein [Pseudomonas sp. RL_15y_Pfl2_60]|uniref:hypothetical protein n=1 Tax=Pseudomonas sp. RL_15y_Pfl2_60 TaxID=3088709 RepID=UPI0030DB86D7
MGPALALGERWVIVSVVCGVAAEQGLTLMLGFFGHALFLSGFQGFLFAVLF